MSSTELPINLFLIKKACIYSQVPSKGGGVLIGKRLEKILKFSKRGVGFGKCETALTDYARTERTKTGCHKAYNYMQKHAILQCKFGTNSRNKDKEGN